MDSATSDTRASHKRSQYATNVVEKKRIQDRLAQRASRARIKNRLVHLEQRLASFNATDHESEIVKLTDMLDNAKTEAAHYRDALTRARAVIDKALVIVTEQHDSSPKAQSNHDLSTTHLDHAVAGVNNSECLAYCSGDSSDDIGNFNDGLVDMGTDKASQSNQRVGMDGVDIFSTLVPGQLHMSPFQTFNLDPDVLTPTTIGHRAARSSALLHIASDIEKWHVSNNAVILALDTVAQPSTPASFHLDFQSLYTAITMGWDTIEQHSTENGIWKAFRQLDEQVFGTWTSNAQRIALIYVCQALLRYREVPTIENLQRVPLFLRPRPSQERIQHPPVIDFLIWPALRDRLVFEYMHYISTGDFSAAFVEHFHFYWPYSDADIFVFNTFKNQCEVSEVFLKYLYDIKNWTMKPGFFKKYPEMRGDIAEYQGILQSSSTV